MNSLVKARRGERVSIEVTPESAGWTYLDYLHPDYTWIHDDWDAGAMTLPTAGASAV